MRHILYIAIILFLSAPASAQTAAKRTEHFNHKSGVMLGGYDPVSYFNSEKPFKGRKELASSYQGVTYFFASASNKAAFAKSPSAFEPQYGGWCAFSLGDYGEKVESDPKTYKIVNKKLYVFYNKTLNNTLRSWTKNEGILKKQADANWKKVLK